MHGQRTDGVLLQHSQPVLASRTVTATLCGFHPHPSAYGVYKMEGSYIHGRIIHVYALVGSLYTPYSGTATWSIFKCDASMLHHSRPNRAAHAWCHGGGARKTDEYSARGMSTRTVASPSCTQAPSVALAVALFDYRVIDGLPVTHCECFSAICWQSETVQLNGHRGVQ